MEIRAEQIRIMYKVSYQYIFGGNFAAWLLAEILWNQVPHFLLIGWLILVFLGHGIGMSVLLWTYKHANPVDQQKPNRYHCACRLIGMLR